MKVDGFTHWIEFEFSQDRLTLIREHHNERNRSSDYLAAMKIEFGESAEVGMGEISCNATWSEDRQRIFAQWQPDSQRFFDVEYGSAEPIGPQLPDSVEREIFAAFVLAEDQTGRERALATTASRFSVTEEVIFAIGVKGIQQGWPLPEPRSSSVSSPSTSRLVETPVDRRRESERKALPAEDRRAYDSLRDRDFPADQAAKTAASIRRLCEAGGGRDCS